MRLKVQRLPPATNLGPFVDRRNDVTPINPTHRDEYPTIARTFKAIKFIPSSGR